MKLTTLFENEIDWDAIKVKIDDDYDYDEDEDYNLGADNEITITTIGPSGQYGYITWDRYDGEILRLFVGTPYRRMGMGTYLYELAQKYADEKGCAEPEHSSRRSEAGDAWANAVGGYVPDLTDDIDGWSQR